MCITSNSSYLPTIQLLPVLVYMCIPTCKRDRMPLGLCNTHPQSSHHWLLCLPLPNHNGHQQLLSITGFLTKPTERKPPLVDFVFCFNLVEQNHHHLKISELYNDIFWEVNVCVHHSYEFKKRFQYSKAFVSSFLFLYNYKCK